MKVIKWIPNIVSHSLMLAIGFMLGIYLLPVMTAPPPPPQKAVQQVVLNARYLTLFVRDREDSDFLHWGEGAVAVAPDAISFIGDMAPGPDYRVYLSPQFVETEAAFNTLKPQMVDIGSVKNFKSFVVYVPPSVDIEQYNTVIIWCEAFSQFITSAKYRSH